MENRTPSIIDLDAELAKLTMVRRTPQSTREETKGSVASLASYRDGLLLAIKSSGTDHWERHLAGDELVHILDGSVTLEIVCGDGPPQSFELRAGMLAVIPQRAWHRSHSKGNTHLSLTPFPGDHIELDVDDPRTAEPRAEGGNRNAQHHRSQCGNREVDPVPRTDPAIDDGRSTRKRRAIGVLPRRRPHRHEVRGEGSLGSASCRRADSHPRRHRDPRHCRATTGPQSFTLARRNAGGHSAGCVAPFSARRRA